jgi:hypothetical protein
VHGARCLIESLAEPALIDVADERIERPIIRPGGTNTRGEGRNSSEAPQHEAAG